MQHRNRTRWQLQTLEDRVTPSNFMGFHPSVVTDNLGSPPGQVAVGDFNGDAKQDLLTADTLNGVLKVSLGNGNGSFQAPSMYVTGNRPWNPIATDFNGDGKLDIACTSGTNSQTLHVFIGNGNGTFQSRRDTGGIGLYRADDAGVADFNGDGKPDIVLPVLAVNPNTSMAYNILRTMLNDGNGWFSAGPAFDLNSDDEDCGPLDVGDVNGDGKMDVVIAHEWTGRLSTLLGNGNGSFTRPNSPITLGGSLTAVKLAHVSGDSKPELFVSRGSADQIAYGLNNGAGGFNFSNLGAGDYPHGIEVADVDRDGQQDLVVANRGPGNGSGNGTSDSGDSISLLLGNANGTFQPGILYDAGVLVTSQYEVEPTDVKLADMNNDGQLDLVIGHGNADTLTNTFSTIATVRLGQTRQVSVSFAATSYTVAENAGTATITLTRTGDLNGSDTVNWLAYAMMNQAGWATAGTDFLGGSRTTTFAPNEASKTVTVTITNDHLAENPEKIGLALVSGSAGVSFGTNTADLFIQDDDPRAVFTMATATSNVSESAGTYLARVIRSGNLNGTDTVDLVAWHYSQPGWANDSDWSGPVEVTLTFNPGETEKTVPYTINDDELDEGSERFRVGVIWPSAGGEVGTPVLTDVIIDDNDQPALFALTNPITQVSEAATTLTYTITRTQNLGKSHTVEFMPFYRSDLSGWANGSDFTGQWITLTFAVGESTKTGTVTILNDNVAESPEKFGVALVNPGPGVVLENNTSYAEVTILDDDPLPTFSLTATNFRFEETATTATLTIVRTANLHGTDTVNVVVEEAPAGMKATAGTDFTPGQFTLTFAPGVVTQTVPLGILNDSNAEFLESFAVRLQQPSGVGMIGNPGSAIVTLEDDDGLNLKLKRFRFVDRYGQDITTWTKGMLVYIQADFMTQNLSTKTRYYLKGYTGTNAKNHRMSWGYDGHGQQDWSKTWRGFIYRGKPLTYHVVLDQAKRVHEVTEDDNTLVLQTP